MQATTRELRGAWTNKAIKLFTDNAGTVDSELIDGFKRFSLPVADDPTLHAGWMTAYHGTKLQSASLIFVQGALAGPRDGGRLISHGQCGSTSLNTIHTSPSKELAAFPTYSTFFPVKPEKTKKERGIADGEPDKFGQIIFEVKVRPGYKIQPSTLFPRRHWPAALRIDPRFESHDALEWLHESRDDVVLTGILVRQFGKDSEAYGSLNCMVGEGYVDPIGGLKGADYRWTALRVEDYKSKGSSHEVAMGFFDCCAYVRKEGDSRVLASVMWRRASSMQPRLDAEKEGILLRDSNPMLHRVYLDRYPMTSAVKTERITSVERHTSALMDVYLCVEKYLVEAVKRNGFTARVRPNIAVESSVEAARCGYSVHHRQPCAVFKILPSSQLQTFCNPRGSLRVNSNFIPSHCLQLIDV